MLSGEKDMLAKRQATQANVRGFAKHELFSFKYTPFFTGSLSTKYALNYYFQSSTQTN